MKRENWRKEYLTRYPLFTYTLLCLGSTLCTNFNWFLEPKLYEISACIGNSMKCCSGSGGSFL